MDSAKQLKDLSKVYMEAVYGGAKKEEKKDTRLTVTAADKKANTKAYQNYKAGNKAYKAADHLGEGIKGEDNETRKAAAAERKAGIKTRLSPSEGRKNVANLLYKIRNAKSNPQNESVSEDKEYGYDKDGNSLNPKDKKAKKDFDGDGKLESPEAEYKGSKDKAIKKEVEDLQKAANTGKGKYVAKADKVKVVGEEKKSSMTTYKYDDKFYKEIKKDDKEPKITPKKQLLNKEETIIEKETPKQVAAVIDYYRSKKGTGEAVKDTEEGDTKDAKKERDYAAFERGKMKKDDPDWKHKKGSTSESVESDEYIETVQKVKAAETQADIKRWGALKESGKFTVEELETMAWDIYEADSLSGQVARWEAARQKRMKQRQSYERPNWIPKDQDHEDSWGSSKGQKTTKENYQAMRNPEKEEKKDKRSAREKRMADPEKGINSPAFKEFMRQQGM